MQKEMKKSIKASLITLGVFSIVCAILGLVHIASSAYTGFSGGYANIIKEYKLTFFYQALFAMYAICVVFYMLLLLCGVFFLKLQTKFTHLFIGVMVAEVLYFLFLRFVVIHLTGGYAQSIGAAAGVATGGLMVQYFILFPLWGTVLALWTSGRLQDEYLTNGSITDRD